MIFLPQFPECQHYRWVPQCPILGYLSKVKNQPQLGQTLFIAYPEPFSFSSFPDAVGVLTHGIFHIPLYDLKTKVSSTQQLLYKYLENRTLGWARGSIWE
jgi:hypothetical protein